jgi:hypothetical protein
MEMKTVHDESHDEPPVQDISENEKIPLERSHHSIKDLMGTQLHHDFGQNDDEGDKTKTDVCAPSTECLIDLKPEEFHISDVPPVTFRKKSSRVRRE